MRNKRCNERPQQRGGRRNRVWCLGFLLPALVFSSSAAAADSREDKERAAKKACLSGDYAKGVSLLTDLYVDTNDATYIFNQGRCYEQGNRCEEAIVSFREYLRKTKDAGRVSDGRAEQHIAECEELLRKARAEMAATPVPPVPGGGATATGPEPEARQAEVQAALPPASTGRGLRVAGAVTFGVGVAAIGAGVGFALAANKLADELEASPSSYDRGKASTRSSYITLSTVSYATGAACIAGGVVLYVLGWRQGRASSTTVQPMVSARSAGALVQVSF
jgi:hypothetical protein